MDEWEKKLRKKRQKNDLIINRPKAMGGVRRKMEMSVTTIGWIVWIFICRPIFIVILWFVGFRFFYEHMINLGGLVGLREKWVLYAVIILVVYIAIRGWNVYNKIHYGNRNRRKESKITRPEELDVYFQFPEQSCRLLQDAKEVSVDFGEAHRIKLKDMRRPDLGGYKGFFKST